MSKCELYKDTQLTFRIYGNIYIASMKMIYMTFNDKVIEVFYDGKWYPAKIIGKESKKKIIQINEMLFCSNELKFKQDDSMISTGELQINDEVSANKYPIKLSPYSKTGKTNIRVIKETDIESDWLFGIEFIDSKNQYYTLSNALIISAK